MKIQQISVFLENKPGHLNHAVKTLSDAGINLITMSLADTEQFGILRIIVKDWQKAESVLKDAGFVVKTTQVLATEVEDRPGGLGEVLAVLDGEAINIEYMYALSGRRGEKAVIVFRFDDVEAAAKVLCDKGIGVVEGLQS